ncbi:MAG: hypothetical protein ACJA0T_000983 [Colwellia sp.]
MLINTFEYCSLHYLNQWLTYDRNYCLALAGTNREAKLSALKSAGGFYRVARNVPTAFDVGIGMKRFQPVLEILDNLSIDQFEKDPVKKILDIESQISSKYGNRGVLSLTTKFLWLKLKSPILIYDAQARIAVNSTDGDLAGYYKNWAAEFENHEVEIQSVCSKLSNLNLYVTDQSIATKEYVNKISSNKWFHERVFDIYLWSKGNNG